MADLSKRIRKVIKMIENKSNFVDKNSEDVITNRIGRTVGDVVNDHESIKLIRTISIQKGTTIPESIRKIVNLPLTDGGEVAESYTNGWCHSDGGFGECWDNSWTDDELPLQNTISIQNENLEIRSVLIDDLNEEELKLFKKFK